MEGNLTLSELNTLIRETLQLAFPEQIWIVAEIAELKVNRNGHCYLELVDKDPVSEEIKAKARATIWSWQFRFIQPYFETSTGQALTAGLKVLLSVSVEFHEVYGFSLNIKDIDPTYTLGDLARKRQEIIDRLSEEGVIDMNRELPFPDLPSRIAIVSSPTAAGYEDFINQLHHNSAGYRFFTRLFPATLQGNDAPASMIKALEAINEQADGFDVVVIVRGGGSQMDLNSFDQYELAYHVAQFPLPVLTGIGHEKDDTIVDRVAHTKLKTPTAVAEFLIGKYDEAAERIEEAENDFLQCVNRILNQEKQRIDSTLRLLRPLLKGKMERWSLLLAHRAEEVAPLLADTLEQQRYRLIRISDRLGAQSRETLTRGNNQLKDIRVELTHQTKLIMLDHHKNWTDCKRRLKSRSYFQITKHQDQISWFAKTLSLVDPANILKRGFSITLKNGKALIDARAVEPGDQLEHVLYKGRIRSVVEKQTKPEPGTKPSK